MVFNTCIFTVPEEKSDEPPVAKRPKVETTNGEKLCTPGNKATEGANPFDIRIDEEEFQRFQRFMSQLFINNTKISQCSINQAN